ncbi:peptidoglycan DD-metalloendopeptidase family protein [Allosphingosinicella flava]|uniref:Peptidoglycan DD-metalloendopeptidase family protein n=1 Tax=Allosphingosinicella flava TaxID=2771430 RepID=A0A7T2GHV9_9SPHN|nr:peptidoglycan DD-metalloendopeptidase family protein [Sphingosinicella flava]QPQ54194.1 peptidoglycan DD-metalloendopeptidase family protein [Sphingosinicella flava]
MQTTLIIAKDKRVDARLILLAALLMPLAAADAMQAPLTADEAQREAAAAAADARRLEQSAAQARDTAAKARLESDLLVARIEAAEAGITAADARLAAIEDARRAAAARLAERQQPVAELTAALAAMARRPAALAFAEPGSLKKAARMRAVLDAVRPALRAKSAALLADLDRIATLKRAAARTRADRAAHRLALTNQRSALAAIEAQALARSAALSDQAFGRSNRALALSGEVFELRSERERQRLEERAAASLAILPGPPTGAGGQPPRRPTRSPYALPAAGKLLSGMGEVSAAGIHNRGLTFAVTADRDAVAPAGGRVVYAGSFRSYGEIVIVDHGGGWTSLVTGLATLSVRAGDRVATGQPIGRTGRRPVTVELRRDGRPFPIAPLAALG